jgi:hypothetical protein
MEITAWQERKKYQYPPGTSFQQQIILLSYEGVVMTRENAIGLHKIHINAQFSFKLCGDVGFHGYFSTLLISGRSDIDYGKHAKGWNTI